MWAHIKPGYLYSFQPEKAHEARRLLLPILLAVPPFLLEIGMDPDILSHQRIGDFKALHGHMRERLFIPRLVFTP